MTQDLFSFIKRRAIIKCLDNHDIWEHVIMNYIPGALRNVRWRKDGMPYKQDDKYISELNHIIEDVMDIKHIGEMERGEPCRCFEND